VIPLVYYALVTDTKDPLGLGRVAVKLKGFPADVTLTDIWLRMVMPAANNLTGIVWLPEVGDEVAVLRAGGDTLEGMLILGAVYNGTNLPIYKNADGDNITKEFRTKAGNAITFTDTACANAGLAAGARSSASSASRSSVVDMGHFLGSFANSLSIGPRGSPFPPPGRADRPAADVA